MDDAAKQKQPHNPQYTQRTLTVMAAGLNAVATATQVDRRTNFILREGKYDFEEGGFRVNKHKPSLFCPSPTFVSFFLFFFNFFSFVTQISKEFEPRPFSSSPPFPALTPPPLWTLFLCILFVDTFCGHFFCGNLM